MYSPAWGQLNSPLAPLNALPSLITVSVKVKSPTAVTVEVVCPKKATCKKGGAVDVVSGALVLVVPVMTKFENNQSTESTDSLWRELGKCLAKVIKIVADQMGNYYYWYTSSEL
jgi:hypothetical protein